jgi:Xaa-Pro dipeptidase
MPDVQAIQTALKTNRFDGWLFYDHHRRDPIASRILGLPANGLATRRWFYFIPAKGEPRKLVHRIEAGMLDSLPGGKQEYSSWEELHKSLGKLMKGAKTVAMQYSPENNIPYIGLVDAGTVELVRKLGRKVASSANLVQQFEAAWTDQQLELHLEAGKKIDRIIQQAFQRAGEFVREGKTLSEYDLAQWIREQFEANSLESLDGPVAAVPPNNANPHYEPKEQSSLRIRAGDLLLLDLWAKLKTPNAVYYDITWMGFLGEQVPEQYRRVFAVAKEARLRTVKFIKESVAAKKKIHGWEVDKVCRDFIKKSGYAKNFVHRTGHSIGIDVHGNGANMDGLETKDDRLIVPHTCFSVEPGIYLKAFGIRTECNVYVGENEARVTGAVQEAIIPILA